MNFRQQLLYGLYVDAAGMDDVIDLCHKAILIRRRILIGVLNAAKVVNVHRNKPLRDAMLDCDLVLADGQSLVWASKLLRKPLPERITGVDIFERLLTLADTQRLSIALLGATPDVLDKAAMAIDRRFPKARIVYHHHGFFTADESAQIATDIAASQADMLFLGITSPKKEIFLAKYGYRLDVPILHGVGGAFDIMAGVTTRAPHGWQKAGMEWAYRLLQEPRRLWWRYTTTNLGFIVLTLRELFHPSSAFGASSRHTGNRMVARLADNYAQGAADE
jgi:N-acetylglucosaminyldiphosphoundecaprenol N-acetyl-beta-D-mannosaminyltransferase